MNRGLSIQAISDRSVVWDCLIIGGGATGLGAAVEAASRGLKTLLIEKTDFAKGTSSRATKLAHGGVRYLGQGDIQMVRHALKERGLMLRNAPHLVHPLRFIIPAYQFHEKPFYGIGLTIYDLLSGKLSFGRSKVLSRSETVELLPTVETNGLRGGVLYYDGQFDDARLATTLAQTLSDLGGFMANYAEAAGLLKDGGKVSGVIVRDVENDQSYEVRARVVVNATGVFVDQVREFDQPGAAKMVAVSQGAHLVLPKEFNPGTSALMVPKTSDGRVLFGIPWHNKVIIGTTDHEVPKPLEEPEIEDQDISFILTEAARYLAKDPTESDVLSCYVGLRPLVKHGEATSTAKLSRDHTVVVSPSGMITITGGKWTTYRRMGEDCINHAVETGGLSAKPSRTETLHLHGYQAEPGDGPEHLTVYGTDRAKIEELIRSNKTLSEPIHPRLPYSRGEVVFSVREEMARTVEDVLSRRTRSLLLDSAAAVEAAPTVAKLLSDELHKDSAWEEKQVKAFQGVAKFYQLRGRK